ncbi:MAG: DUF305 domain-containing protein [Chloroflexaceae bacterium]|nr:DUF305 domain-containing protein [Chloroflexaceae bacterium]NJL35288.1 DUF305 domain-containing protein [Chloroflexaceae bacterium]
MLVACGSAPAATVPTPAAETEQEPMDHGAMTDSTAPYDAQFIDGMIVHHQGAITMAQQVLEESERPELRALAEAIITAQQAEIEQMQTWRSAWYPDLAPTGGMDMDMGPMAVAEDSSTPFDIRFIDAMIPHHEGAVAMAQDALQNAEYTEIKQLSEAIIAAQQAEIEQMQAWREAWSE